MGTNYYLVKPESEPCPHCGRTDPEERLHIGKSSAGWCFALHVEPDDRTHPQTLGQWVVRWSKPGVHIEDEYGERVTPEQMRVVVMERERERPVGPNFNWTANDAEPAPGNLIRARVGEHCVGHGSGTWDLIPGWFR